MVFQYGHIFTCYKGTLYKHAQREKGSHHLILEITFHKLHYAIVLEFDVFKGRIMKVATI